MRRPVYSAVAVVCCLASVTLTSLTTRCALGQSASRPPSHQPVPPAEALGTARTQLHNTLTDDSAKVTVGEKASAAQRLANEATKTADAATRYVLLEEALDLAMAAADVDVVDRQIGSLAYWFDIDRYQLQAEKFDALIRVHGDEAFKQKLADYSLRALQNAIRADAYLAARKLRKTALIAAREAANPRAMKQVLAEARLLGDLENGFNATASARATLETQSTDPAANAVVGKFLCFAKDDWNHGLLMLALGDDARLQTLARRDLESQSADEAHVPPADAWQTYAPSLSGRAKTLVEQHAEMLYCNSLAKLDGLSRLRVLSVIESLDRGSPLPPLLKAKPMFDDNFTQSTGSFIVSSGSLRDSTGNTSGTHTSSIESGKFVIRHQLDKYGTISYRASPWTLSHGFACQILARAVGPSGTAAGLRLFNKAARFGFSLWVDDRGTYWISPGTYTSQGPQGPQVPKTPHSAILPGEATNMLLLVVSGRRVWLYVNGIAVHGPMDLTSDVLPVELELGLFSLTGQARVEFERVTVWPADVLPAAFRN